MNTLTILIILALVATIISLLLGVGSMAHGGSSDEKHSGQFMNARVIFQGIALLLMIIALVASL